PYTPLFRSDLGLLLRQCLDMHATALAAIEQFGQWQDAFEQLAGPDLEFHLLLALLQMQTGAAAFLDHLEEVAGAVAALATFQQRAVFQRAVQQEGIDEARLRLVDA